MTDATKETRDCPHCKEEILADAIKCKHCHSKLTPDHPDHGGTCPFCKETIKPDAIKCKHCRTNLLQHSIEKPCHCTESISSTGYQRMNIGSFIDDDNGVSCIGGVMWCNDNPPYGWWYRCGSCSTSLITNYNRVLSR